MRRSPSPADSGIPRNTDIYIFMFLPCVLIDYLVIIPNNFQ